MNAIYILIFAQVVTLAYMIRGILRSNRRNGLFMMTALQVYLMKYHGMNAEEPKEEKDLLLIFTWQDGRKSYSIGLYSSHAKNVFVSEGRNFHWKKLSMYSKWAYIDELLPTGINK